MAKEHEAWLVIVEEWKRLFPDRDMNDPTYTPLVKAIEVWGERLVALREYHEPDRIDRILAEKIAAYEAIKN